MFILLHFIQSFGSSRRATLWMRVLYWLSSRATEPEVGCRLRGACWESQRVDGSGSSEDRIASGGGGGGEGGVHYAAIRIHPR